MAQQKIFDYFDLNTSTLHNQRAVGVISPGVYSGYNPKINAATVGGIDLDPGSDGLSVLITSNGVAIREDTIVSNAVTVSFTTTTLDRWDLCVLYNPSNASPNTPATYEMVRGTPAATPSKPEVPTDRVGICYIYVSGSASSLTQSNLVPIEKQEWTKATDITPLKPKIDYTNTKRIFVYPGSFPNSEGNTVVRFEGGYSEEIDDNIDTVPMIDGAIKYVLFGIGDDGLIAILNESATDFSTISVEGINVIALCIAKFKKTGSLSYIESIEDVRFPFTRKQSESIEVDSYLTGLSTMTFQYLRVDTFATNEMIDVSTAASEYTVTHEFGFTRLKIVPNVWPLTTDFTITTKDLVDNTPVDDVDHILVTAQASSSALTVDFSSSGVSFSGTDYPLAVKIPAQSSDSIYVQFKIPATDFTSLTDVKYINNYGVYMKSSPDSMDVYRQGSLALPSIKNLISNPFTKWSKGNDLTLSKSSSELSSTINTLGPDGWQVVSAALETVSISKNSASLATPVMDINVTTGTGTEVHLEYRIPAIGLLADKDITFGFNYLNASTVADISCGIRTYNYQSGLLTQKALVTNAALPTSSGSVGRVMVTAEALGSDVAVVGFVIIITANANGVSVYNPQAMYGKQYELAATLQMDPSDLLSVYETGRSVFTGSGFEGALYSNSTKIAPKNTDLGTTIITRSVGASRSKNVRDIAFSYESDSIITSASANTSGVVRIDIDYECFIKYILRIP